MIPSRAHCEWTSGPFLAPRPTSAANGNSLNCCPASGMSPAGRRGGMIPLRALHARALEVDTRCGIQGRSSTLAMGLDQHVKAMDEGSKLHSGDGARSTREGDGGRVETPAW